MIRAALFAVLSASPVLADCAVGTLFLSCTLKGGDKALEVCRGEAHASYWFGRANGKAELALTAKAGEFAHTPWPGVGRTIWEEMVFHNGGVSYTVYGAHERMWSDDENEDASMITTGGIIVSEKGEELTRLECDAGSVVFPW